jgi:Uma2 family endonuclease
VGEAILHGMSAPRAHERPPAGIIKLTYDDYLTLPDDGRRYEILDGDLEMTPAPSPRHQAVSRNLQRALDRHVTDNRLGSIYNAPIDVILAPTTIVQPDLLFLAAARRHLVTERAIEGPPDLIVEILSPSTAGRDRAAKATLYARFGVSCYWIVDPEARTVEIHILTDGGYRLAATHAGTERFSAAPLPDLTIDLAAVWE